VRLSRRRFWQSALILSLLGPRSRGVAADTTEDYVAAWTLIEAGRFGDAARLLEPNPAATTYLQTRVVRAGALYFGAGDFVSSQQCFESALAEPAKTDGTEPDLGGDKPNSFLLLRDATVWRYLAQRRQGQQVEQMADAASVLISPLKKLIAGQLDMDTYVERETSMARAFYDARILNVAEWKGKEDFVRRAVAPLAKGYRCVGNFALAEQATATNQRGAARAFFTAALATDASDLLEYHIAKTELTRLG
jgi:hypothetical protein